MNLFFLKLKKIKKKLKKIKKPKTDTCHVLFKNVNYLNTISEKDQFNHNLKKNKDLIEYKMKIRTKFNKNNKNKNQMYI